MTTLNEMIDEVLMNLAGYTLQQDRTTYLRAAVTTTTSPVSSPTILSLGSTENIGKGVIEINEELLWVDSFDRVSNTAVIAPYGRGYLGTSASTHAVEAKVTISPTFPRHSVKRAINDTIRAMGSVLYAVKQTSFTYNPSVITYKLDDINIQKIITMHWQDVGPSKEWIPIKRWDFDSNPYAGEWGANAQTVNLYDFITPGRIVKVTYATRPTEFTSGTQQLTTQTGFPESVKDVVILGAVYRLLNFLDPARSTATSPQADETDAKRPYGSSNSAARQVYTFYVQRLNEEILKQQQQYPPRIHYTR